MPEGHTIHRIARDQKRCLIGRALSVTSPQGRFETEARQLDGEMILQIEAWGKHLFYDWSGGQTLHIHLGFTWL